MSAAPATGRPARQDAVGQPLVRLDAVAKVRGTARYAAEQQVGDVAHVHLVLSSIAKGRIVRIDTAAAAAGAGVLTVLTHDNAPRLASDENRWLWVLQDAAVAYRGQPVAAVVARTSEAAREGAALVAVTYDEQLHDVTLSADHPHRHAPAHLSNFTAADTSTGDVETALALADVVVDERYTTPMESCAPMEPHAATGRWDGTTLTLHDSTQGVFSTREEVAAALGLEQERVRVVSRYVGGGFGSKGFGHPHEVLTALAAMALPGRWVRLALTRQQTFTLTGHRAPTIQRVRLGADRDGHLGAIAHDAVLHTSTTKEFAEPSAGATRILYAAAHRATTHRVVALDVPLASYMRAPGEASGMFALEVAMDELAERCHLDPVQLRLLNEPEVDPASGLPWSSRGLVQCLVQGARRFGWHERDPTARRRLEHGGWVGTGVASATYPVNQLPTPTRARVVATGSGYRVQIAATDIGTGSWTALTQIAADELGVDVADVEVQIGDTDLPPAVQAGASAGTTGWGSAIVAAVAALRREHGDHPPAGAEASADLPENPARADYSMHAFGAHFAQVRVDAVTGEVSVPRLVSVFDGGRIVNPRLARSQLVGGMVMGVSMALHEDNVLDATGHVANHDLADYHVSAHADIGDLQAHWLQGRDPWTNPMGTKGIGEIGVVGTAAAIANAVHHATGVRVRDLPITLDALLG